jgi:hypothetical protein
MGFFYHLYHRRIQKLGLEIKYRTDEYFSYFCACSLSFLSLSHIKEAMDYLKAIIPPDAKDQVNYFDSDYVSDPLRRIGTDYDLSFRRLPPQSPPPM